MRGAEGEIVFHPICPRFGIVILIHWFKSHDNSLQIIVFPVLEFLPLSMFQPETADMYPVTLDSCSTLCRLHTGHIAAPHSLQYAIPEIVARQAGDSRAAMSIGHAVSTSIQTTFCSMH